MAINGQRAPRDGRCTFYLLNGNGRCHSEPLDGEILCAAHMVERKGWGNRLRVKRREGVVVAPLAPPTPLPDWMLDPSLLPKRPPGRS